MSRFDAAVCIGRFQPLQQAHLALIRRALALAPRCVVVVGSAFQARTSKHPLTGPERIELIRRELSPDERPRVGFLLQRDHADDRTWLAAVRRGVLDRLRAAPAVAADDRSATNQPSVVLVGHWRDPTDDHLRQFDGWSFVDHPRVEGPETPAIWDAYYACADPGALESALGGGDDGSALARVAPALPASTREALLAWFAQPRRAELADEWRHLQRYHAAWAGSPFPPVFVTVDAVLCCAGHVLLIRRGHWPGRGLFALPGGFIESRETVWQSTLRELGEETALEIDDAAMRAAHRGSAVFDRPDRSQRGRTITHALHFDLGDHPLPSTRAGDDAAAVSWVPIAMLPSLEDQFHDDHFQILEHVLGPGILPSPPDGD